VFKVTPVGHWYWQDDLPGMPTLPEFEQPGGPGGAAPER